MIKAKKKKRNKNLKGISRIEQPERNIKGWYVRVYFRGRIHSCKFFNDKKYSGRNKALHSSREYRDNEIDKLKKKYPNFDRIMRRRVKNPNSNTGVLGVSRVVYFDHRREKHYECFSVSWRPEPGTSKVTKFSINKYGEKEAFRKACALRRKKEIEIYGPRR